MNRWHRIGSGLFVAVASALLAAAAAAQTPLFREARRFDLGGTGLVDMTPLSLVDVGSPGAPPDGIADVVTVTLGGSGGTAYVLYGAGDGTFGSRIATNLQVIPTAMAVIDLDGDGAKDLLVTDSNSAYFFRGGPFGPPFVRQGEATPAGDAVVAVSTTDLNGDGKVDAIVVDEGTAETGAVKILIGNGDGTFIEFGEPHPTGGGSSAVALGRFNADAHTDLAVTNEIDSTVSILFGDGRGGFESGGTVNVGEQPSAIASADVNGDGKVDLVVLNTISDDVSVLDGRGDGSFAPERRFSTGSSGAFPVDMAVGDVDKDGDVDLAVANKRSCDTAVLRGDGRGSFSAPRSFVTEKEPVAVTSEDLDGDGNDDVVTVNTGQADPNVGVLLSRGDGTFSGVEDLVTLTTPNTLLAADLDNDGLSDLLLGHSPRTTGGDGPILIYRSTAESAFIPATSLASGGDTSALGRGDLNADGYVDVIAVSSQPAAIRVYPGAPGGGFGTPRTQALASGGVGVAVGDWNRDGRDDVAIAERDTANVEVFLSRADGSFGLPRNYGVGNTPESIDSGDFNNDGNRDLAVVSSTAGQASILLGSPAGSFTAGTAISTGPMSRWVSVADFDRDGNDDLAVGTFFPFRATVQYGDGTGAFPAKGPGLTLSDPPATLLSRDVTGDGLPDLLFVTSTGSRVSVFRNFGASRQFDSQVVTVSGFPTTAVAADFDADGRSDLATASGQGGGALSVATNIGAGTVRANLLGSKVAPPVTTNLRASCGAALAPAQITLNLALSTARLTNAVGAHVHVGAPGRGGAAIFTLFTGASSGSTLSSPLNKTLKASDLQPDPASGIATFDDALQAIRNGRAYVDIHTTTNPNGEIRGQLLPLRRGDGNGDLRVSAADATAVMREMGDGTRQRAEDAPQGRVESTAGIDANGDGDVTLQDAFAVVHWTFTEH